MNGEELGCGEGDTRLADDVEVPGVMIMPPGCERYDEAVELLGDDTLKVCRAYAPELDTVGLVVLFSDWARRAEAVTMAHLVRPSRDDTRTVPVAIYVASRRC